MADSPQEKQKPGGLGAHQEKDSEVVEFVNQIIPKLEELTGLKFQSVEPIKYKKQVVAGLNYFVKAKAQLAGGEAQIVHLRIYVNLQRKVELTSFQLNKNESEDIQYFQ